jgi:L-lactate dehydrogenase complex protein LldG
VAFHPAAGAKSMSIQGVHFLQRVREAVTEGNPFASAPPLDPRGAVGYQGAGADPVARFRDEFAAAGGFVHVVADAAAAGECVVTLLRERCVHRALLGSGAVLDSLELSERLKITGLEMSYASDGGGRRDDYFAAEAGISGVDYLIAETGSLVLLSRPEQPRSLSLLPPIHIAVARRDQILPDLFDLFASRLWGERGGLPSCLSLITGPSKTGDIELRLVTGVHGPGEVHVVLIAATSPLYAGSRGAAGR